MKRFLCGLFAVMLLCACIPALADDGGAQEGSTLLKSLTHNCTNTGIMRPQYFDPYQTTYLLTVASWVSRPTLTPTAMDPDAVIRVNGQIVRSGQASPVISMTNEPQTVTIEVTNGNASTTYTVYIQRRPSERRTRVSAGYINSIYLKGTTWRIDADLVSINYMGDDYNSGNLSTFTNKTVETKVYDYEVDPHCIFYYGSKYNCTRAINIAGFMNNYTQNNGLYTFIYIEDKIVAVLPYGAD